ncbi:MAG: hypothetical protein IJN34_09050 [Clostridia bacterium]|nr:hypothetical protein [Clostridia bacterium]
MKRLWIVIILILFTLATLWGIHRAAAGTHAILGDADYKPFIQEIF